MMTAYIYGLYAWLCGNPSARPMGLHGASLLALLAAGNSRLLRRVLLPLRLLLPRDGPRGGNPLAKRVVAVRSHQAGKKDR